MPAGNAVSAAFGQLWQESLDEVGVGLTISAQEFGSLRERVLGRDFDALALGSVLAFESDPEQLWHSRWSEGASSNRSGIADEQIDALIEAIQVELDPAARAALLHRLQRRVYQLQPFLFGVCAPHPLRHGASRARRPALRARPRLLDPPLVRFGLNRARGPAFGRPMLPCLALPLLAVVQLQDPDAVQQTIVTATRRPTTSFETPFATDEVSAEEIERRSYRTTPQALRDVPGVMVQETSHGQGSPYIRGFTAFARCS